MSRRVGSGNETSSNHGINIFIPWYKYIYVSVMVQNAHAELLRPNARMLKVSIGR